MKVYVKKEDREPLFGRILITLVFLLIPIFIFVYSFWNAKNFMDVIYESTIELCVGIFFFLLGIYFIYAFFKRPKRYIGELVNKSIQDYNGKKIVSMTFKLIKDKMITVPRSSFNCYTFYENSLVVGERYVLRIKEFDWTLKYVEELEGNPDKASKRNVNGYFIVALGLGFIFGTLLILSILGIFFYPKYSTSSYLFSIGGCLFLLIMTVVLYRLMFKDYDLSNIPVLSDKNEIVGNVYGRNLLVLMIFYVLLVVLLGLLQCPRYLLIFICVLVLVLELPIFLMLIISNNQDNRLIKKYGINVSSVSLDVVSSFKIFRASKSRFNPLYFIVDSNNNLLFKVKRTSLFTNVYAICDAHNKKVGEIRNKSFSPRNLFIVRIVNETPFIVRAIMPSLGEYQVIGRNYFVKGDLIASIICDDSDKMFACIMAPTKNNLLYDTTSIEVVLGDGVVNNSEIISISLCVLFGKINRSNQMGR